MIYFILKILLIGSSISLAIWFLKVVFSAKGILKSIDEISVSDYELLRERIKTKEGVELPQTIKEFRKAYIASRMSQATILFLFQIVVLWGISRL